MGELNELAVHHHLFLPAQMRMRIGMGTLGHSSEGRANFIRMGCALDAEEVVIIHSVQYIRLKSAGTAADCVSQSLHSGRSHRAV